MSRSPRGKQAQEATDPPPGAARGGEGVGVGERGQWREKVGHERWRLEMEEGEGEMEARKVGEGREGAGETGPQKGRETESKRSMGEEDRGKKEVSGNGRARYVGTGRGRDKD